MNKNNKSGRLILLSCCMMIVVAILSGCTTTKELTKRYIYDTLDIDEEETVTIKKDQLYGLVFDLEYQKNVSIKLEVKKGGNIDLLLMDEEGYDDYSDAMSTGYEYYPEGTRLDIDEAELSCTLPPGKPHLIIDNTHRPSGGADPTGSVTVYIKISS